MAKVKCEFFSEVLGISTSMTVLLPEVGKNRIGMAGAKKQEAYPVLYLLHGLSDDDSTWTRRTALERYVAELGIVVVMPNGYRGFYTNTKTGENYFDYIANEVPSLVQHYFPISSARNETFVAGLSMGGYGAMKLALHFPERYAAAASFSGALDMESYLKEVSGEAAREKNNTFGTAADFVGSENDLFALAKNVSGESPRLYQACGTEDFLYAHNQNFRKFVTTETNLPLTYEEGPGSHTWDYWDSQIQKALQFFSFTK
ncbi:MULTISPECIES: alpha/beta hydrolase family protein [Listeria]|uniref:alpha/beta hydrolase n=1 Tax=Listeria TaxID=1637 RepID=UPI000B591ECF|nr:MULTISPECIES: alpha/beta hydrolase family protein [Listeria]